MSTLNVKANSPLYEIVFKTGQHGTINDKKNISYPVIAGDIFSDELMVKESKPM